MNHEPQRAAEELILAARKSIADFCVTVCRQSCCKRGRLFVREDEVNLVTQGSPSLARKTRSDLYKIILTPCPSLNRDAGRCLVYDKRPPMCQEYPIRLADLDGEKVLVVNECDAVSRSLLDSQIEQIKQMGYRVI